VKPRCGRGPQCWQHDNCSSHSSKAVWVAEILVHARLCKSKLIYEPCVVNDSSVTVHIIRRTKLPIRDAVRATGDTVMITRPGPAHSVAHTDDDQIRHKGEFVSYRTHSHIENLATDYHCCRFRIPRSTRRLSEAAPRAAKSVCLYFGVRSFDVRQQWSDRAPPQLEIIGRQYLNPLFRRV
jgi:hypothetical protein